MVIADHSLAATHGLLQWRHRAHDRIRDDPRAARAVRPRHARGRRIPSIVGPYAPRSGECARGAAVARRRRLPAGALGNVCAIDPRLGPACRDLVDAWPGHPCQSADAATGGAGRARRRSRSRAVVAGVARAAGPTAVARVAVDQPAESDTLAARLAARCPTDE